MLDSSQVCKESDLTSREIFDVEFQQLVSLVPAPPSDNQEKIANYKKAMEWFNKLYQKRERWAARWTWEHHSAGRCGPIPHTLWCLILMTPQLTISMCCN